MPWIAGRAFSASIFASTSSVVAEAGNRCSSEWMPISLQARTLFRTYTCEAGFSPTMITASPGVRPCATRPSTRGFQSARTLAAIATPSISCAVTQPRRAGPPR